MPRSRRVRQRALTQTRPRGRERKTELLERVQSNLDKFERCFVFSFQNFRSSPFKSLRAEWSDSRFVLGKNKVVRVAVGHDREESFRADSWKIGQAMVGEMGLLFTDRDREEVVEYFAEFGEYDFARAGSIATVDFTIPKGPLKEMIHSMVHQLTLLGVPVELREGIIHVLKDTPVCVKGEELTAEAAQLLKLFNKVTAIMRVDLVGCWEREKGQWIPLLEEGEGEGGGKGGGE